MRRFKGEQGTSAVEFALIISLLFIVLFGIIQFGIAYNRYQGINAGAREGARLGSLEGTTVDQIRTRVLASVSILNPSNISSSYTCPGSLSAEQGCIEVSQEGISATGQGTGTYTVLTSGGLVACDDTHKAVTLKVVVKYRMRITIPLWASTAPTASGTGIFKCE